MSNNAKKTSTTLLQPLNAAKKYAPKLMPAKNQLSTEQVEEWFEKKIEKPYNKYAKKPLSKESKEFLVFGLCEREEHFYDLSEIAKSETGKLLLKTIKERKKLLKSDMEVNLGFTQYFLSKDDMKAPGTVPKETLIMLKVEYFHESSDSLILNCFEGSNILTPYDELLKQGFFELGKQVSLYKTHPFMSWFYNLQKELGFMFDVPTKKLLNKRVIPVGVDGVCLVYLDESGQRKTFPHDEEESCVS